MAQSNGTLPVCQRAEFLLCKQMHKQTMQNLSETQYSIQWKCQLGTLILCSRKESTTVAAGWGRPMCSVEWLFNLLFPNQPLHLGRAAGLNKRESCMLQAFQRGDKAVDGGNSWNWALQSYKNTHTLLMLIIPQAHLTPLDNSVPICTYGCSLCFNKQSMGNSVGAPKFSASSLPNENCSQEGEILDFQNSGQCSQNYRVKKLKHKIGNSVKMQ